MLFGYQGTAEDFGKSAKVMNFLVIGNSTLK